MVRWLISHIHGDSVFGWHEHLSQWPLGKADCSPQCGWAPPKQLKDQLDLKDQTLPTKRDSPVRQHSDFIQTPGSFRLPSLPAHSTEWTCQPSWPPKEYVPVPYNKLLSLSLSERGSHSVMSDSLQPHGLYSPWNSPGQNTGVGSLSLLQGIFLTQGSNWGLLDCRPILYQLSY